MTDSLVIHQPTAAARELILLFHGVGAMPDDMVSLGRSVAAFHQHAMVVSVAAPLVSDLGQGRQWFSVRGITDINRDGRVEAAMAAFVKSVQFWQAQAGVGETHTTLIGFSQGAIMALAATQLQHPIAGRIIAIAGRLALWRSTAHAGTVVHLVHGAEDLVIPSSMSLLAHNRFHSAGVPVTVEVLTRLGHAIDARVTTLTLGYLQRDSQTAWQ